MPDIVHVTYNQTGESTQTNASGMRDMQARAFEARNAQYLLLQVLMVTLLQKMVEFIG